MASINDVHVVIVGAGISGLYAAKALDAQGVKVTVLEASDRVGGRIRTLRDPSYNYADMGATYVGRSHRRVVELVRELGLETIKTHCSGKTISLTKEGKRFLHEGITPVSSNPMERWDVNNLIAKLNEMSTKIPLEDPWNAQDAEILDSMTVKDFLEKTCWTRSFGNMLTNCLSCTEPHEESLLYFLWGLKVGGGISEEVGTSDDTAQGQKIIGGCQQLCDRMADHLKGKVLLRNPVIRITEENNQVTLITASGITFKCDYVICTASPSVLSRITFIPALPPMKQQLLQRVPMGSIIKTLTYYSEPHWTKLGYSGETISGEGPVCYSTAEFQENGSHPAIKGNICGDKARELSALTKLQRIKVVTEHYAKIFKSDEFLTPVNYIEKNWMDEQYIGGGFGIYMPPGVLTKYAKHLNEPHGRVLFAGTDYATAYASYMEGALQSTDASVNKILQKTKTTTSPGVSSHL